MTNQGELPNGRKKIRKLAVGVLAGGIFALSAGTAMAVSWHDIPTLTTGGASFKGGQ
ncbi:hypothetical protein ACN6K9_005926 [Streptomyces sp. SAS_267]|uniref:hypothetical protein n=1 Tax=Streptomyces sp. SAS_267 TaxID=3412750 RepID=UPI00403D1926